VTCHQITDYCSKGVKPIKKHNADRLDLMSTEGGWATTGVVQRRNDFVNVTIKRSFPSPKGIILCC
jgi:hypothetical protein